MCAFNIITGLLGIALAPHIGIASNVKHRIGARRNGGHKRGLVCDLTNHQIDLEPTKIGQVRRRSVQGRYRPALFDQFINQIEPDKAGTTGYECSLGHGHPLQISGPYLPQVTAQRLAPV